MLILNDAHCKVGPFLTLVIINFASASSTSRKRVEKDPSLQGCVSWLSCELLSPTDLVL